MTKSRGTARSSTHPVVAVVALLTGAVALIGLAVVWWLAAYVWGRDVAATVFALLLLISWSAVHLWRRARSG